MHTVGGVGHPLVGQWRLDTRSLEVFGSLVGDVAGSRNVADNDGSGGCEWNIQHVLYLVDYVPLLITNGVLDRSRNRLYGILRLLPRRFRLLLYLAYTSDATRVNVTFIDYNFLLALLFLFR